MNCSMQHRYRRAIHNRKRGNFHTAVCRHSFSCPAFCRCHRSQEGFLLYSFCALSGGHIRAIRLNYPSRFCARCRAAMPEQRQKRPTLFYQFYVRFSSYYFYLSFLLHSHFCLLFPILFLFFIPFFSHPKFQRQNIFEHLPDPIICIKQVQREIDKHKIACATANTYDRRTTIDRIVGQAIEYRCRHFGI